MILPTGTLGSPTRSFVRRKGIVSWGVGAALLAVAFGWPVATAAMWAGMMSAYHYYRGSEFALRRKALHLAKAAARLQQSTQGTVEFVSKGGVDVIPGATKGARESLLRTVSTRVRKYRVDWDADVLSLGAGRTVFGRADSTSVVVTLGRNL